MVLWLVKIVIFFVSAYVAAQSAVKYFRGRNSAVSASDPEILALAAIAGAVITGLVIFIIKRLI